LSLRCVLWETRCGTPLGPSGSNSYQGPRVIEVDRTHLKANKNTSHWAVLDDPMTRVLRLLRALGAYASAAARADFLSMYLANHASKSSSRMTTWSS
jgi:hypothetical protein